MSDRPREDGWWLASDGKWYPPDLASDQPEGAWRDAASAEVVSGSVISSVFTKVVGGLLTATAVLMLVSSFFGFRFAADLRSGKAVLSPQVEDVTASEIAYSGWLSVAVLMFVITGVVVIVWIYKTSKILDARGATGRRWRGAWTIWSWIIPFANFVLPKLVFNEIEKIAQVPYTGEEVKISWKVMTRTQLADVWWLLWIGGVLLSQVAAIVNLGTASEGTFATGVTLTSLSYIFFAAAGIALALVIRRIEMFSRR
jgi:hypothetical protein